MLLDTDEATALQACCQCNRTPCRAACSGCLRGWQLVRSSELPRCIGCLHPGRSRSPARAGRGESPAARYRRADLDCLHAAAQAPPVPRERWEGRRRPSTAWLARHRRPNPWVRAAAGCRVGRSQRASARRRSGGAQWAIRPAPSMPSRSALRATLTTSTCLPPTSSARQRAADLAGAPTRWAGCRSGAALAAQTSWGCAVASVSVAAVGRQPPHEAGV